MINFFRRRHHRFYKNNRWHLVLDLAGAIIIIILLVLLISWKAYRPFVDFGATNNISHWQQPPVYTDFSLQSSNLRPGEEIALKFNYSHLDPNLKALELSFESLESGYSFWPNVYHLDASNLPEEGQEIIKLKVSGPLSADIEIAWQVKIKYQADKQVLSETMPLPIIRVLPELKAQAAIYYNSIQGDQLGVGPLPPRVGIPTNYWVFLQAAGPSSANIENFLMSVQLPANVIFTGQKSLLAGSLSYSPDSRRVIWSVSSLGSDISPRAGFEIQLLPTSEMLGKNAPLLQNIRYSAHDKVSGEELGGSLNNLDSGLLFDPMNRGQGIVRE